MNHLWCSNSGCKKQFRPTLSFTMPPLFMKVSTSLTLSMNMTAVFDLSLPLFHVLNCVPFSLLWDAKVFPALSASGMFLVWTHHEPGICTCLAASNLIWWRRGHSAIFPMTGMCHNQGAGFHVFDLTRMLFWAFWSGKGCFSVMFIWDG